MVSRSQQSTLDSHLASSARPHSSRRRPHRSSNSPLKPVELDSEGEEGLKSIRLSLDSGSSKKGGPGAAAGVKEGREGLARKPVEVVVIDDEDEGEDSDLFRLSPPGPARGTTISNSAASHPRPKPSTSQVSQRSNPPPSSGSRLVVEIPKRPASRSPRPSPVSVRSSPKPGDGEEAKSGDGNRARRITARRKRSDGPLPPRKITARRKLSDGPLPPRLAVGQGDPEPESVLPVLEMAGPSRSGKGKEVVVEVRRLSDQAKKAYTFWDGTPRADKQPGGTVELAGIQEVEAGMGNHLMIAEEDEEQEEGEEEVEEKGMESVRLSDKDFDGISSDDDEPMIVRPADKKDTKGKGKARAADERDPTPPPPVKRVRYASAGQDDSDEEIAKGMQALVPSRKKPSHRSKHSTSHTSKTSKQSSSKSGRKAAAKAPKKRRVRDPDDESGAETEEEADVLGDLAMDEPERFQSQTRLRKKKESAYQRKLRKLRAQRLGEELSPSVTGSETATSDSAASSGEEDFIEDDGGEVAEGLLPHGFSHNAAQTPEFKFKVVFHYFVYLVVKGPKKALPLRGDEAEYFLPQLEDWRRRIKGHKEGRVRGQTWKRAFVQALETFPVFETEQLAFPEDGCDACNLGGKRSRYRVELVGDPYDSETYEPISESGESSDDDRRGGNKGRTSSPKKSQRSSPKKSKDRKKEMKKRRKSWRDEEYDEEMEDENEDLPREFMMGRFCHRRSDCFHKMSHWEKDLYLDVKRYYHDLLRALVRPLPSSDSDASDSDLDTEERRELARRRERTAGRVEKIRRARDALPKGKGEWREVDRVTEWMDEMGYQGRAYRWMENLIQESEDLEKNRSTADE